MTSASGTAAQLNPAGLNWPRAVMILDVMLVPLVVFWAIGHQEYLLSAVFGALFTALADREAATGGAWCAKLSSRRPVRD